jgi:hypothetical protein
LIPYKELMEYRGWKIWVGTEKEKGSTFYFAKLITKHKLNFVLA